MSVAAFESGGTVRCSRLDDYRPGGAQIAAFAIPRSHPWDEALTELRAMRDLADDWDGNGATAPGSEIINSAIEWAQDLFSQNHTPPSSVMAGPNGTILFNWQDENGYFDAELTKPHYVEWMRMVPGRPTQHGAFELITSFEGQRYPVQKTQGRAGVRQSEIGTATVGAVRFIVEQLASRGSTLAGTM